MPVMPVVLLLINQMGMGFLSYTKTKDFDSKLVSFAEKFLFYLSGT